MRKYEDGKYTDISSEEMELLKQEEAEYLSNMTVDEDEMINLKIRERYTESEEFAILRQKDEKPEEFREYYDYCELCKKMVRERL